MTPPSLGQRTPVSLTGLGGLYLQAGYPLQAMYAPKRPCRRTSGWPDSGHISPVGSSGRASGFPPAITTLTMLRHLGYAVHPRNAEPVRLCRSFIGEPHSSHIVLSSSVASMTSSSGSGMFSVKVQAGYPLHAMKSPFLPMRSFSFLPHLGHFSESSGATGKERILRAWPSGMPALPETMSASARSRSRVKVESNSDIALRQEIFPSSTSSKPSSIRAL